MVKIGISLRIKSEILQWVDEKVEEAAFASRVHTIEYILCQLIKWE